VLRTVTHALAARNINFNPYFEKSAQNQGERCAAAKKREQTVTMRAQF
jgi:hypothetical protein